MKHLLKFSALVLISVAMQPVAARADDHVTVTTVSHYTNVYRYTVNTPGSVSTTPGYGNTNCTTNGDYTNCSGTYTPRGNHCIPWEFREFRRVSGQEFRVSRVSRVREFRIICPESSSPC
jgi:hypothetical protein